jgi:hypothetical protein
MKVGKLVFGLAAVLCVGATANASIVIPTNFGVGADAEVRESQFSVSLDDGSVTGTNNGASTELATRGNNTTVASTGDKSSLMYMKFDISSLPAANDSFWNDKQVILRGHIRNGNLPQSRLKNTKPGGNAADEQDLVTQFFNVAALEPGHVYADDAGGTTDATDRSTNPYQATQNKYEWDESGITFYNAPGITPFCMVGGSCDTATYGGTADDVQQSLGLFDDLNGDVRMLGNYKWPHVAPQNHLAVGSNVDFIDVDLKQLVLDAKAAGRDSVTLIQWMGADTLNPSAGGTVSPSSFLNFNYLWVPKEATNLIQLPGSSNDNSYDPDVNVPNFNAMTEPGGQYLGSPFSCTFDAVNRPNCTGTVAGDNSTGRFSPQLIVRVPEPCSVALVGLASVIALALGRRRK